MLMLLLRLVIFSQMAIFSCLNFEFHSASPKSPDVNMVEQFRHINVLGSFLYKIITNLIADLVSLIACIVVLENHHP